VKSSPSGKTTAVKVKTYVQPNCKFSFDCPIGAKIELSDSEEESARSWWFVLVWISD